MREKKKLNDYLSFVQTSRKSDLKGHGSETLLIHFIFKIYKNFRHCAIIKIFPNTYVFYIKINHFYLSFDVKPRIRAKKRTQSFPYKVLYTSSVCFLAPISAIPYQLNKSEKVFPWFIGPSEWKSKTQNKAISKQLWILPTPNL